MLLLPWAIAPVANAVLWKWIYHSNYGILNAILLQLGIIDSNVTWLGDPFGALNMILWSTFGNRRRSSRSCCLRPCRTFRRASIAPHEWTAPSTWQSFRYVTLPSLKTAIAIAVILQTIWALRVFDLIFVLTKGGPADGTVVMNFLAYRVTFNFLNSAMARRSPMSSSSRACILAIVICAT